MALIARYRLSDTTDSSGNGYDGTATNATYVAGKIGYAASFNGNGYIASSASALNMGTGDWTACCWVKTSSAATSPGLLSKRYNNPGSDGWGIFIRTSGRAAASFGAASASTYATADTGVLINDGSWHHVVGVWDRDGLMSIYVDGVTQTTVDISSESAYNVTTSCNFLIGALGTGTTNFITGLIDDVRIYNEALSAKQIRLIYNDHFGLIAHYKLNNANDSSGNNLNGNATNVTYVGGRIDTAASFAGNSVVRVSDDALLNFVSTMSVSCWCKVPSLTASSAFCAQWDLSSQRSWVLMTPTLNSFPGSPKGSVAFMVSADGTISGTNRRGVFTTSVTIDDGLWHHVAATFNAGTITVYVDGVSANLTIVYNNPVTSLYNSTADLTLGTYLNNNALSAPLTGLLDDVRLYESVLSASQVSAIMAEAPPTTSLIAYYKLEDANDSSGNSYNGTATDVTYTTGKIGNAASFNGTTSNIIVNPGNALNGKYLTVCAWIYQETNASTYPRILDRVYNGQFSCYINAGSARLCMAVKGVSGAFDQPLLTAANTILPNIWYHCALVYDGTKMYAYINGALAGSSDAAGGALYTSTDDMHIGERAGGQQFKGLIDDLKVFDEALSAARIRAIYNDRSGLVAHYKLSNANDSSGNNLNGTATNVTYVGGRIGNAASFAGNGVIRVSDNALLNFGTTFSVAFWCKIPSVSQQQFLLGQYDVGTDQRSWCVWTAHANYQSGSPKGTVGFFGSQNGTYVTPNRRTCWATTATIDDNLWHHVALTFSAGAVAIYVDGVAAAVTTLHNEATSLYNSTADFTLGCVLQSNSAYYCTTGLLDDVRLYDNVLSAAKVSEIMLEARPQTLLAYYKLSDANDSSGNSRNGTATNVFYVAGRVGNAALFNGSTSMIDCGSDFIGTSACTISAWIYLNGWGEGASAGNGFGRILDNGKILVYCSEPITTNNFRLSSNAGVTTAFSAVGSILLLQWYHVAVTRTAEGVANFYINGTLSGTANQASGEPTDIDTTNLIIGNNAGATRTFDGVIDDLRIYNGVLSAAEILAIYNDLSGKIYSTKIAGTTSGKKIKVNAL